MSVRQAALNGALSLSHPVQLPACCNVTEIGDDYVTGIWKDETDVEHVRAYELVKS